MKKNFIEPCSLIVSLIISLLISNNLFAQELKLTKRVMTSSEFSKLKSLVGSYEPGRNYNEIINGHGTGLRPPTEEEWKLIRNQRVFIDKLQFSFKKVQTPSSYDNSKSIWFPPIGDQGSEGSCVSWACGYYTKTFQEAREHNWDLSSCFWEGEYYGHPSAEYQNKIFSPDFIYHQVNNGGDNGSYFSDNMDLLERIGCCTWDKMPYSPNDHITWPTEAAWRQAPLYRSQTGFGFMDVSTISGIQDLKQLLADGNLALISMDAYFYSGLTNGDLWTLDNYTAVGSGNHANTVVGYDDNYGPYTESGKSNTYGAFKVANSWGVGIWEKIPDGFYYISYECMKQRMQQVCLYQNIVDYRPKMVAVFEMNYCLRGENRIDFGIGSSGNPDTLKPFDNFIFKGGNVLYPNNPIVIDITEFTAYMSGTADQFFMMVNNKGSTGIIQYFSVETYDDYAGGVPKNVYVSNETPVSTLQNQNVYANVFTSSESIVITYPKGGEVFDIGSNPVITYTSSGTSGHLNIDYSTDAGVTWNSIATNTIDDGDWRSWIVPNVLSSSCKIRITDIDGTPSVVSKGLFRIGPEEFTEEKSFYVNYVYGKAIWGDYDNDGDLDFLVVGGSTDTGSVINVYSNYGNSFTEKISIPLSFTYGNSAQWGDFDNDGYLDILSLQEVPYGFKSIVIIYHNNGDNTFSKHEVFSLSNAFNSSIYWADYDNDGDLDFLLTFLNLTYTEDYCSSNSIIYRNNGDYTFTEQTSIAIIGIGQDGGRYGSAAWGDYDNDGDLDLLLTGPSQLGRTNVSKIYRNNGNNSFTEQTQINLMGVTHGSVTWGDYDNDGDLDIILTGVVSWPDEENPGIHITKVYRNNGNNLFTEQTSVSLASVHDGSASWGDYDNDGDLDILLTGAGLQNSKIYRNNGDNAFIETAISLDYVGFGSAEWGDYDNDGDLDIILTGNTDSCRISKIYSNNRRIPNTPPSAPIYLRTLVSGNDVKLSWDVASDNETPQKGLTYNLVIGSSPGGYDILSPMSDRNTGHRRIVSMGNTNLDTSWTIKGLANGQYYWSVQAIDNCFAGSPFAPEQSFNISGSHFVKIWENAYTPMNIYVTSAAVNGVNLTAEDEIAVFDGGNCVGVGKLTGPIPAGGYLSIIASADDPTTPGADGFVSGHTITYKIWDQDRSSEIVMITPTYSLGDGKFNPLETASVSLSGIYTITQVIALTSGWNIFSLETAPQVPDMLQLLNPLITSGKLVKVQDEDGKAVVSLPGLGWINEIGNCSLTEGYYLKINDNTSLSLSDPPVDLPITIPLNTGWNIISYPVPADQDALAVLQPLITSNKLIKVQDETGNAVENIPGIGWVNNIGNFRPGEGYYVKVQGDIDLILNNPSSASSIEKEKKGKETAKTAADHFNPIYKNNPYLAMNIYVLSVSMLGGGKLEKGDEIGIFDGSNCVGAKRLNDDIGSFISVVASTDDPTTPGIDGFTAGHDISYRFWISSKSIEVTDYEVTYTSGSSVFSSLGTSTVTFTNVLPVEIVSFTANASGSKVVLNWETATEINNYGFDIERRLQGNKGEKSGWSKIGFLEGNGNSSSPKEYSFVDKKLSGGTKFSYRLKQVDVDGSYSYSKEIEIEVIPDEYNLSQNYPNPFNPRTTIQFSVPKPTELRINIYTILGERVLTAAEGKYETGYYQLEINCSSLPSGIYIYRLECSEYNQTKKMMILK